MDTTIYKISYKMRMQLYRRVFSVVLAVLLCFAAVTLFLSFVVFPVTSRSTSMSPDIPAGSHEFVVPLMRSPRRGDVILLQPGTVREQPLAARAVNAVFLFVTARRWCPFQESGTTPSMRRVVGVPGDTIYIDKYVAYIQPKGEGHFLSESETIDRKYTVKIYTPPVEWDSDLGAKSGSGKVTLGEDEYFVLGDNRMECADSRIWGAVPRSAIRGRVVLLFFPFNKIRIF